MQTKKHIRKKYFLIRKKKYFEIDKLFFKPFLHLVKKEFKNKKINLSIYYPSSYEINVLNILEIDIIKKMNISLPIVEDNNLLNFFKWKKNDILNVNKYGILEPMRAKKIIPDIVLVPLLAYDKLKFRLGYGKGFYDRYLTKISKTKKNFLSVGIAFSFQKYHNLPVSDNDMKLDYILTEKGII